MCGQGHSSLDHVAQSPSASPLLQQKISNLNLVSFSLNPFPFVLLLNALVNHVSSFLQAPSGLQTPSMYDMITSAQAASNLDVPSWLSYIGDHKILYHIPSGCLLPGSGSYLSCFPGVSWIAYSSLCNFPSRCQDG